MISVLFVCHANFCRSPLAEALLLKKVDKLGLADKVFIRSAGVSDVHLNEPPHERVQSMIKRLGVEYDEVSTLITTDDFYNYDYILTMDKSNLKTVRAMRPQENQALIAMFLDYAPHVGMRELEDPCQTGRFRQIQRILDEATSAFLDMLMAEHDLYS